MSTSKRVSKIAGKELESSKTPKKYRPPIASALEGAKKSSKPSNNKSARKTKK